MVYLSSTTYLIYAPQPPRGYLKKDWALWKYPLSQDTQIEDAQTLYPHQARNFGGTIGLSACGVYIRMPRLSLNNLMVYS
jgi:hypothetical protein